MRRESVFGFYVNREKALTTVEDMEQAVRELDIAAATVIYSSWTSQQIHGGLPDQGRSLRQAGESQGAADAGGIAGGGAAALVL